MLLSYQENEKAANKWMKYGLRFSLTQPFALLWFMIKLAKTSYKIVQQAKKCKSECKKLSSRRLLDSEIDDEREKFIAEALTFKEKTDEYARQVIN